MTYKQLLRYYGSATQAAQAMGVSKGALGHWKEEIPPLRQAQLFVITGGELKISRQARRVLEGR